MIRCRLCGHEGHFQEVRARCQFDGSEVVRYVCTACDVIFGPLYMIDMPVSELTAQYVKLYAGYSEADATDAEVALFKRCLNPQRCGKYLNYGSGKNRSTGVLRAEGCEVFDYDTAVKSTFSVSEAQLREMRFDGVFSHNTVEHLQDPITTFRMLYSLLVHGGSMVHASDSYRYVVVDTRFHLFFFQGRSVDFLAAATGFQVAHREADLAVFKKVS